MMRHPDQLIVLLLLAIALMLLAPVVAQPGGLIYPPRGDYSDLTITHWPNIAFSVESLRSTGHIPLWRPTIMSGTPFAANPLSGLFYFPHVIFLVVPLAIGFNVLFIAHVWLTGCGAYGLLRVWQVERSAAFVGALTWMATPKLFAHLGAGHVGMVEAVAWLTLALLAMHRVVTTRRAMDGVRLGAVWAVQFLADPRVCFYSVALTTTYFVFHISRDRAKVLGVVRGLMLAILSLAVLSAILWLPFAEFISQSSRGALTLAEAGEFSIPLRQLVSLLLVNWGGLHEWAVYVGILPLVLAAIGLVNRTRRTQHVWLMVCLVSAALFSLGTNGPLFPILFRLLPGLTLLRVPPRAWFIVAFAVAVLCAFGVEAMLQEARKPHGWVTLAGVVLAAFALMFGLGGFFLVLYNPQAMMARASMLHLALVVPVSVAVVLLRAQGRIGSRSFAAGTAVVIVATLLPVDLGFYRVVSEAQAFSDHADVATWLSKQPGTFRVYSPSYSLPQQVAQRAALEQADGVDPMQVASYARLMQTAAGMQVSGYSVTIPSFPPDSDVRTALRDARPDARLLGQLNVRYVVAEFPIRAEGLIERTRLGATFVYENSLALPRASVEGGYAAQITMLTPDRIAVTADGPGTLTLSQVNYPGWRATVDGRGAPIQSVDTALMGVRLQAGHHVIEFTFDPWTIKVGVIVSAVGWLGLLFSGLRKWQWKRAGK